MRSISDAGSRVQLNFPWIYGEDLSPDLAILLWCPNSTNSKSGSFGYRRDTAYKYLCHLPSLLPYPICYYYRYLPDQRWCL